VGETLSPRVQGGRRGRGKADGATAGEMAGRRDAMEPRVDGEVQATNNYWQQIFATAGVHRVSTTAARKNLKKSIRGATEKGANH